eukprot:XP_003248498.2 PREDICTED: uncharacterized protein LOC100572636 [Acyrthosiphon pisum]
MGEISDFVESNTNSYLQVKRKKGLKVSKYESNVKKPKHSIKYASVSTISENEPTRTNVKPVLAEKQAPSSIVSVINEMNYHLNKFNIKNIKSIRLVIANTRKNKCKNIETSSIQANRYFSRFTPYGEI